MIRTRIGGDICSDAGGCSVKAEMGAMSEFKDVLHACKAGEYFDLPQLVVVGDQSSGKSSVLEGLTSLPFPRDSGLCTRFATHITFRRSREAKITISIIPNKSSSQDRQEELRKWNTVKTPYNDNGVITILYITIYLP